MNSIFKKSPKKIGLALGGGAALGAVHIGVLKAIEELNINIEYISGTSIGSLIAALYAFEKTPKQIEKVALKLNWLDISRLKISKYGVLNNSKIKSIIRDQIGNVSFKDSKIPVAMVATDLISRKKVILKEGSIEDAVLASTCIPGVFSPIIQNDMLLVDGGVVENVPVSTLETLGAKFKISVDLTSHRNTAIPKNIIDVIISSINLAMLSSTISDTKKADIQISPDLGKFSPIDSKKTKELIDVGYNTSLPQLQKYF
jgi:NTE family protein